MQGVITAALADVSAKSVYRVTNTGGHHMEVAATEFASANEAIQYVEASGGGHAIRLGDASGASRFLGLDEDEAHRLEAAGVAFAYIEVCSLPDGFTEILVTIPVN
jgi:hypothetical protein